MQRRREWAMRKINNPGTDLATVNHFETAKMHQSADAEFGNEWECACASCRRIKRAALEMMETLRFSVSRCELSACLRIKELLKKVTE